jgi:hypothetical protein
MLSWTRDIERPRTWHERMTWRQRAALIAMKWLVDVHGIYWRLTGKRSDVLPPRIYYTMHRRLRRIAFPDQTIWRVRLNRP